MCACMHVCVCKDTCVLEVPGAGGRSQHTHTIFSTVAIVARDHVTSGHDWGPGYPRT